MRMIRKTKPHLKITGYSLFYTDKKTGQKKDGVIYSRLLSSERYGLAGKPDYVFKRNQSLIPVELKSGSVGGASVPREGDLMQLVAYFIILNDEFGIKPRQGRIIYSDCMFVVENKRKLRRKLLSVVDEMRLTLKSGGTNIGEPRKVFIKCRHCICRETVCRDGGGSE